MSLEVKYIDAPPGAQKDMSVEATNANTMSQPQLISVGSQETPWATMEPLGWPLDGSRELTPDEPSVGFWSTKTSFGAAGVLGVSALGNFTLGVQESTVQLFETPPVITLLFPERYTATGITFTFSPCTDEWCSEIRVRWYSGQTLLADITAYPDAARWTLVQLVESFDQIQIELLKTNKAGHFAKVEMIEIGQTIIFGKDELTSVRLVNEIDPTLSDLTVDTMAIDIQDKHDRSLSPQENQRMELYRNGKLLAAQYIVESRRQSKKSYSFSCQSAIGLLEDTFLGGMYKNAPVDAVISDILDGKTYEISEDFVNETVTGYLPVCTRREALQQLAFAIGAVVTTQGTDAIRFIKLPGEITGNFKKSNIFLGGKVETTPRTCKIEAVAHSYTTSEETETLVDNEVFSGDDILLTFDAPHHDYVIAGGRIIDSGVNYVKISAEGTVTLVAKTYIHNTVRHSRYNAAATAAERNNVQTIEDATLVHSGNIKAVLNRLYQFTDLRQTLTQDVVVSGQYTGQKVAAEDPWGGQVRGYITSMDSALTQSGHTAAITILGVRGQTEGVYCYAGQLFSGDTEVVF